ncbi:MAG: peptide chain release factor-like protein, partial [Akkermansia sp.]|nr:peptide chain release factor-like protein [Akkermansia sp.]
MAVSLQKRNELAERMKTLGVLERDLEETFVRGSGKGGQKVNKTNNCVCLV